MRRSRNGSGRIAIPLNDRIIIGEGDEPPRQIIGVVRRRARCRHRATASPLIYTLSAHLDNENGVGALADLRGPG